jgi:hypothetical protein
MVTTAWAGRERVAGVFEEVIRPEESTRTEDVLDKCMNVINRMFPLFVNL